MKKLFLTTAIVLALGMTSFAGPNEGGLFQRGAQKENTGMNREHSPFLPGHGGTGDADADTPVGTGVVLLAGLGAAYLIGKKRREE